MDIYITFDNYYNVEDYNNFIENFKNNNNEDIKECINVIGKHFWYLKINEKYKPNFLKYDIKKDNRFLYFKITPLYPNEEYILKRKAGQDMSFLDYIYPKKLLFLLKNRNLLFFRSYDEVLLKYISKEFKCAIYRYAKYKDYSIYYTSNFMVKNLLNKSDLLLDYYLNNKDYKKNNIFTSLYKTKELIKIDYYLKLATKRDIINKTYLTYKIVKGNIIPLKRDIKL